MLNRIIKFTRRFGLVKRVAVMVLIFIAVPCITISYFALKEAAHIIDEDSRAYAYQSVRNIADVVNQRSAIYKSISHQLNVNPELTELLYKYGESRANGQLSETAEYKRLINSFLYDVYYDNVINVQIITNDDEFTQTSLNGDVRGGSLENADIIRQLPAYKKALLSTLPVWDNPEMMAYRLLDQRFSKALYLDNFITVFQATQQYSANGSTGVIMINISKDLFRRDSIAIDPKMVNVILCSSDGIVLALDEKPRMPIIDSNANQHLISSGEASMIQKVNGENYLFTCKKIDDVDWYVVGATSYNDSMAPLQSIRAVIFNVCLLCIIFALVFGAIIIVGVRDPIRNLVDTMTAIGSDSAMIKYFDDCNDEIAFLGSQFNNMIDRIDNLIKTVYEIELVKTTEELRRKQAQIDMLRMQINPHFIYNMLEIIRWEVLSGKDNQERISDLLECFAGLIRSFTSFSDEPVTIGEEVGFIGEYLEAINLLLDKKIKLTVKADEFILSSCYTIKTILEPIVENAVMHAFKKNNRDCVITIEALCAEDLIINVSDNGVGMTKKDLQSVINTLNGEYKSGRHIGLNNVHERIRLSYGREFGLKVKSELNKGTTVCIRIPLVLDKSHIKKGI